MPKISPSPFCRRRGVPRRCADIPRWGDAPMPTRRCQNWHVGYSPETGVRDRIGVVLEALDENTFQLRVSARLIFHRHHRHAMHRNQPSGSDGSTIEDNFAPSGRWNHAKMSARETRECSCSRSRGTLNPAATHPTEFPSGF